LTCIFDLRSVSEFLKLLMLLFFCTTLPYAVIAFTSMCSSFVQQLMSFLLIMNLQISFISV